MASAGRLFQLLRGGGDADVDLEDLRVPRPVPLGEPRAFGFEHGQAGLDVPNRGILQDRRQGAGRGAVHPQGLDLVVERFLLRAGPFGHRQRIVQLLQPGGDDVLRTVEGQRILRFAVRGEPIFGRFDCGSLLRQLLGQPRQRLVRARQLDFQIQADVFLREHVDRPRRELGVGRLEADVDEMAIRHRRDPDAREDGRRQGVRALGRRGCRGLASGRSAHGPAQRGGHRSLKRHEGGLQDGRLRPLAIELRRLGHVEPLDHAEGELPALQHPVPAFP